MSSKFPIGVETMYKPFLKPLIKNVKKNNYFYLYIIIHNFNSFAEETKNLLKVGLLAPFSGEYKDMGQSIMLSLQLALDEINDDDVKIYPRDSGFNNPKKLIQSIESFKDEGVKNRNRTNKPR